MAKGKNISTRAGKGRVRVPPSQLTGAQRARMVRLGEQFYMDKPSKGPQEGPRDVHGYSGVKKPTRRFTLKRTYGKPKAGTGTVTVSKPTTPAAKDAEALIDFENALTRQNQSNKKRKAAEQMADVEFNLAQQNKRKLRTGYNRRKGGKVVSRATGGKVKNHNGDQYVARFYNVLA